MNRDHIRRGIDTLRPVDATASLPDVSDDFGSAAADVTHTIDVRTVIDRARHHQCHGQEAPT